MYFPVVLLLTEGRLVRGLTRECLQLALRLALALDLMAGIRSALRGRGEAAAAGPAVRPRRGWRPGVSIPKPGF